MTSPADGINALAALTALNDHAGATRLARRLDPEDLADVAVEFARIYADSMTKCYQRTGLDEEQARHHAAELFRTGLGIRPEETPA